MVTVIIEKIASYGTNKQYMILFIKRSPYVMEVKT